MVNSNFGSSNGSDLVINGHQMGEKIKTYTEGEDKGSITVLVATDAPLDYRQLRRVVNRCSMGIARTGSFAGHGSGDVFVGFSTKNIIKHFDSEPVETVERFSDDYISLFFRATVEATEEAVINSLMFSNTTYGRRNKRLGLNEYFEVYCELLEPEIEYIK